MDLSQFRDRAFTRADAQLVGITDNMLRTRRFRRVYQGIYTLAADELSVRLQISAASLAMPDDAQLSHISRIHALGLQPAQLTPIHFTVARDLHLARAGDGILLHRTAVMPPVDAVGVTPAAALVQVAGGQPMRDVLRIGDWLLGKGHIGAELLDLCAQQTWRPGARRLMQFADWFCERSESFPETDCRVYMRAAGLPVPMANVPILDSPHSPVADLWLPEFRLAIEHEGGHHFTDAGQIKRDVWRYSIMRENDISYFQAHREMMRHPKAFVHAVHRALVRRGYGGPPPRFGREWRLLFARPRNH